ncbi:MAG: hypothetical protein QNK20_05740 [Aureibaculum sp.]|nr:hypothetical protein [Aureibaculum sp.]
MISSTFHTRTVASNMRKTFIIIILAFSFGCASQKANENRKNYEITDSVTLKLNSTESIKVNELRFKPNFSSTDLQKFLFEKFGKWNNSIKTDRKLNILVWENIKLFETRDELFTVAASGEDRKFEIIKINGNQKYDRIFYCSAIVFNSKNVDCLESSSEIKDTLAKYFIDGTKSINKKDLIFEKELIKN